MRHSMASLAGIIVVLAAGCSGSDTARRRHDLGSSNVVVRNQAIVRTGEIRDRTAVPVLTGYCGRDNPMETRLLAVKALGSIGDTNAVAALVALLGDEPAELKRATVETLGKLRDKRATEPLIGLLSDPDIGLVAIWALGNTGDRRAVPALERLLSSPDKYVRYNASQAMKRIGSED